MFCKDHLTKIFVFIIVVLPLGCTPDNEIGQKRWNGMVLVQEKEITNPLSRSDLLLQLKNERFDVLILGGGATGGGAALDAATRGLKTALVEAYDFSSGTSSRSTKLVHGGVRYLENAVKHFDRHEYALVRDALHERKRFLENAPHLTNALPILTPVYGWFQAFYYLVGLKLYDFVAGNASLGRSEFLSKENTLRRFPMLKKEGLTGAVLFYDGQFDDARMNMTLIMSALREGAIALNYVRAQSLIKENNKIVGAMVFDGEESWPVFAKVVVNATGVFADVIRRMDDPKAEEILVSSQGSHLILPHTFSPPDTGLIIPKTEDGRVLFLLPWQGKTIVGTTDHREKITDAPKATDAEIEFILEHVRRYFDIPISRNEILATWSGLRPLTKPEAFSKTTAAISRDHLIEVTRSGLVTIVGGKWTTYRKMAEDVINTAIFVGRLSPKNDSLTKDLKLVGARYFKDSLVDELVEYEKLDQDIAAHLAKSYGDRVDAVIDIHNKSRRARLLEGFPFIEAEVIYAVSTEHALHVTDVIARRMRLAFLDNRAAMKALPRIVSLMAQVLLWDQSTQEKELKLAQNFLDTMLTDEQNRSMRFKDLTFSSHL